MNTSRSGSSRAYLGPANPYCAFAATIAAGLYGIENKVDPPEMFKGNAYEAKDVAQVPSSLYEAIDGFAKSVVAREAFGDEVFEHLLNTARQEQVIFDNNVVTDWELQRYFERIQAHWSHDSLVPGRGTSLSSMSFLKYSERDVRGLLARAIRVRWPAERLLVLTACDKFNPEGARRFSLGLEQAAVESPRLEPEIGSENGFLAVTQSRLIFQEEVSSGLLLRAISIVIGAVAIAVLFFGDGLASFLPMATMALALWGLAKILEMMLLARADIEFDRVGTLDPSSQRIEGTGRNGARYRLGLPDPSDFLLVAALVEGRGAAAA